MTALPGERGLMDNERRDGKRVRLLLDVRWAGKSAQYEARLDDISLTGCFIETIGQVSIGEQLIFEVHLPTGRWMALHGEVVHFQPHVGFGLRFINLSEIERAMIGNLIEFGSED